MVWNTTHVVHDMLIVLHSALCFGKELPEWIGAEQGGARRAIDLGTSRQRVVHADLHHTPFRNFHQLLDCKLEGEERGRRRGRR